MKGFEIGFLDWLSTRVKSSDGVPLGIGDDMAIVTIEGRQVLLGCDMLLDGVHFDSGRHPMEAIGRKLLACSLSDCAAMAARPRAVTVSMAAPRALAEEQVRAFFEGLLVLAEEFDVALAGGDTTRWDHPLSIDLCLLAEPWEGVTPVTRGGAMAGDRLYVTGPLGGSIAGKHLMFTPRIHEAHAIAESLGEDLHALMDISDGLALDLWRLCRASRVGALIGEIELGQVTSDAARQLAGGDDSDALEHALSDGEDFELLLAVAGNANPPPGLHLIGEVTEADLVMRRSDGSMTPVEPKGFVH